ALTLACGEPAGSRGEDDTGLTTLSTEGPGDGDPGDGDPGDGDPGDGGPGDGDPTGGGKFDMAEIPAAGNDGMVIPPSCDNIDESPATSVGCEFLAVQLPSNASPLPYGIAVGNPSGEPATVSIEDMRGPGNSLRLITSFEVQPTQSVLTAINGTGGLLPGSHMVSAPGLHEFAAFRVTSDVPITAMQLFPVGGGPSHVSEASMLLPVNALDTSYLAANWQNFSGNQGFAIVVAIEDATTVFTDGGDYMLDAFDAWHFAAGADGTGYYVGADKPVAV